jgi:REP element-mobilizing transposase RayT
MNYRRAYIENSIVFITIVTQNRNPILINKIDTLKHSINEVTQYYDFEIIAYVILNDHLHFLIKTQD